MLETKSYSTPILTLIIPLYNEADNVTQCVMTLLAQTSQAFQAIFIDDGSTDGSVDQLQIALDARALKGEQNPQAPLFTYKIVSQVNSGSAKAREHGIKLAASPYVMFLDCDDLLSENAVEAALTSLEVHSYPDISMMNFEIQQADGTFKQFQYFSDEEVLNGKDCLAHSLNGWQVHGMGCIRKAILQQSYQTYHSYNPHDVNYLNNDEVITRLNFFYADKVVKNAGTYYYLANMDSTTKRVNPNRYKMCQNAIILFKIFGKEENQIALEAGRELVNTLWDIRNYLKVHRAELHNKRCWKREIKKTMRFIFSERKALQLSKKDIKRLIQRCFSTSFI